MKRIYNIAFALLLSGLALMSCQEEAPFATAGQDDAPCIISPDFPNRDGGALATFATISRDGELNIELTVTPSEFTTVTWLIDGVEVESGTDTDKELLISLPAGTYNLKMVLETTAGKTTTREGIVVVNPLAEDPYSAAQGYERVVSPGVPGILYGDNMDKVANVKIAGETIAATLVDGHIEYTVPSELTDGVYRVLLVDAEGGEYGANTITVSSSALVNAGFEKVAAGAEMALVGINLDEIASVTIGDETVTSFSEQTGLSLKFTCPDLTVGEYAISAKDKAGNAVKFYFGGQMVEEAKTVVSAETTLFSGHHYVSWDFAEGDPNRVFNLISKETMTSLAPGTIIRITYSLEPSAGYHQMRVTSGWWTDLPGLLPEGKTEFTLSEPGTLEFILTQDMVNLINEQDGFLIVGHGFFVDLVTAE